MSEHDDILDPTPEELAAAEALRKALDEGLPDDFVRSLKAAHAPSDLDAKTNDALVAKALEKQKKPERRGVVIRVAFGVTAALAVAAALFLIFGKLPRQPSNVEPVALVRVRSTQPLFDKPFDTKDSSARVDRIAMARASDLRENRFARWGVR